MNKYGDFTEAERTTAAQHWMKTQLTRFLKKWESATTGRLEGFGELALFRYQRTQDGKYSRKLSLIRGSKNVKTSKFYDGHWVESNSIKDIAKEDSERVLEIIQAICAELPIYMEKIKARAAVYGKWSKVIERQTKRIEKEQPE